MPTCSERLNVGDVSIRSRNGAPSLKGCVVNGQMTKASNKGVPPPTTTTYSSRVFLTFYRGKGSALSSLVDSNLFALFARAYATHSVNGALCGSVFVQVATGRERESSATIINEMQKRNERRMVPRLCGALAD